MSAADENSVTVLVLGARPPEPLIADLKGRGFAALFASEAKQILVHLPDLIVLRSEDDAFFNEELKNILRIHPAPLVYMGTPAPHVKSAIDDYLPHPHDREYLAFKIRALLQRIRRERDINPLTGLPGNRLINACLSEAVSSEGRAVVYIDINDFKPYNDTYGFGRGDEVIRSLGRILADAVALRSADSFVGHIGGDDFIVLCPDREVETLSREVMDRFAARRNGFYSARDLARGLIVALDRDGRRRNFPLLSLSVVSFLVSRERFKSVDELSRRAVLLKKRLKARSGAPGASVRLRDDDGGAAAMKRLESLAVSEALPLPLRRSLIEALGETGDHACFLLLKGLLEGSGPPMVRKSAAYALGRLKDRRAVPLLSGLLADPNPHLRTRAVEALGEIGCSEACGPVRDLAADGNCFVRRTVMESLGKLADGGSLPVLEHALGDPDAKTAEAAVRALGVLGIPAAVPVLRKYAAAARRGSSRAAATEALGRILCPEAAQAVCESLGDADASVQWQALCRLPLFIEKGFLEDHRPFIRERLLTFAESGSDTLRRAAVIALGALRERRALPALLRALDDAKEHVRWSAALSLGKLADARAVPFLLRRLNDRDDIVRSAVSWALGEAGAGSAVEPLRRSLKDPSSRVREAAASSIARIVLKAQDGG